MTPWICYDVVFCIVCHFTAKPLCISIECMVRLYRHVCIDICSGINPAQRTGSHPWLLVPPLLIILGSLLLPLARSLFAQMDFQAVFPSPDESWRKTCFSFFREVFVYLKTWRIEFSVFFVWFVVVTCCYLWFAEGKRCLVGSRDHAATNWVHDMYQLFPHLKDSKLQC